MVSSAKQFSRRERQIMDILYEHGECTAQQVRLHMDAAPSYSSVRALLAKLVEKKHISFKQDGPRYVYFALHAKENVQKNAVKRLVKTFFGGSTSQAVNALIGTHTDSLDDNELKAIKNIIETAQKNK